jgi:hypothetical protein
MCWSTRWSTRAGKVDAARTKVVETIMRAGPTLASIGLCFLLSSVALAQSPQDRATARNAAEEADKKLAAKDYDSALELFTRADALVPAPTLKVQIGHVQVLRGKLVEAQQAFLDAARAPVQPNESPSWAKARDEASREAAAIKPRIPAVTITVEGPPKDRTVRVTMDGEAVNTASLGLPLAANPGKHVLRAECDGFAVAEAPVDLKEGARVPVALRLVAGASTAVVPPPTTGEPAATTTTTAPPPKKVEKTRDGLFFHVSLGGAAHIGSAETKVSGATLWKADVSGGGADLQLALGGTIAPGFVLGGEVGAHVVTDPTLKNVTGSSGPPEGKLKGSLSYTRVALLGVYYPDAKSGVYLLASLGVAHQQFTSSDDTLAKATKDAYGYQVNGVGVAGGVGYDFPVGGRSAIGGLFRLDFASMSGSETPAAIKLDRTAKMVSPSLALVYTYY